MGALVFFWMAGLFGLVHHRTGGFLERVGYYHARQADLFFKRGLSREFPWLTLREGVFYDPALGLHALMAPFCSGKDPAKGAQVFAAFVGGLIFLLFYLVLLRESVPDAWVPTALLACMGAPFLMRLAAVDSHLLGVLLLLAALPAFSRGEWRLAGAAGFFWSWGDGLSFVLPAAALVFALARWSAGERAGFGERARAPLDWKTPGAALGGALLGLVMHPQFPAPLTALWDSLNALRIGVEGGGMAAVHAPKDMFILENRDLWHAYPLLTALILSAGFAAWHPGHELSGETMGMLALAGLGFTFTLGARQCIEYAAPLSAAAFGFIWRDAIAPNLVPLRNWAAALRSGPLRIAACSALTVAGLQWFFLRGPLAEVEHVHPPRFQGAARWMAENLEPGDTAANLWWSDFPELFYHGSRQRYLTGLDPAYAWKDPRALRLERMRRGMEPVDLEWLGRACGAKALVLRSYYVKSYPSLVSGAHPPAFRDRYAAVYRIPDTEGR